MNASAWLQLLLLIVLLAISTPLLGTYIAKVFSGGKAPGDRVFGLLERPIYRLTGVDPEAEQRWKTYAVSLLAFSFMSVLAVYAFERLQAHLPFNPDHQKAVPPGLSFNTAVSFLTNQQFQMSTVSSLTANKLRLRVRPLPYAETPAVFAGE